MLAIVALLAAKTYAQETALPANAVSQDYASNSKSTVSTTQIQDDYQDDGNQKAKTFSKAFSVSNGDKIALSNTYGNIIIRTWNKNEIKVDVDIKAFSTSDAEAQKLLDLVRIDADKSGDAINFKTVIDSEDGNWGKRMRNGKITSRREVKVNYTVFLPLNNALTVNNKYGNVEMGNYGGPLSMKVQYGNFSSENLTGNNSNINIQYGKLNIGNAANLIVKHQYGGGITIGNVASLDMSAQYVSAKVNNISGDANINIQYGGGLTLGDVGALTLKAQYVKVVIGNIKKGNPTISQQYGGLAIESVGAINLSTQYANVSIARLRGDAEFTVRYNKLNIDNVAPSVKTLNIDGQYAGITVGFETGFNGNLDVDTQYAGFNVSNGKIAAKELKEDDSRSYRSRKQYNGKIGSGGSSNVTVKSQYGNINFQ